MSQNDFAFSKQYLGTFPDEGRAVFHSSLANPLEIGSTYARKVARESSVGNYYSAYRACLTGHDTLGDISASVVSNFFSDGSRYSVRCWVRPETDSAGAKTTRAGVFSKVDASVSSTDYLTSYHMLTDGDGDLFFCGTSYPNPLGETHFDKWNLLRLDVSPIYGSGGTVEADYLEGFIGTLSNGEVTWTSVAEKAVLAGTPDYITPASNLYFAYGFYKTTSTATHAVYFDNFDVLVDAE